LEYGILGFKWASHLTEEDSLRSSATMGYGAPTGGAIQDRHWYLGAELELQPEMDG